MKCRCYDASMRTTVTFDADVAEKLRQISRDREIPFRRLVNDLLRRALAGQGPEPPPEPFELLSFCSAFRPGVDPQKLNQLVDELEAQQSVSRAQR